MHALYDLDTRRVAEEISRRGCRRVLLQLPDGMRPFAMQLAAAIREATGAQVFLSGDSCYGACDIATRQARELGADLLVHYGHSAMLEAGEVPVLYVHAEVDVDVRRLLEECLSHLKTYRRVGVVTTIQHAHQVHEVAAELGRRGFEALVGEGDGVTPHPGQVLGCHFGAALRVAEEVDAFLYVGGGRFHPLGLALTTGLPVVAADPYGGSATLIGPDALMALAKRRMAAIAAARDAEAMGILVSSKPGQSALEVAEGLERRFREGGAEAAIIYLDEVRAEHLNNYTEFGAFVVTACPRIALDGVAGVDRPMLTVVEARVALGDLAWGEAWGRGYLG